MTLDELIALLQSDDPPETIYDDMRNHVAGITSANEQTTAEKDKAIAELQEQVSFLSAELESVKSANLDAAMDSPEDGEEPTQEVDPETITIEDLFS